MNDLKAPNKFAGGSFEGDDRVGPLVIAFADAAVVVRAGAAGGDEDKVAFGIDGDCGPGIACASARSGFECPGDRIPRPTEFSSADVVGTDDAALESDGAIVAD